MFIITDSLAFFTAEMLMRTKQSLTGLRASLMLNPLLSPHELSDVCQCQPALLWVTVSA